eukprot:3968775-Pyramimonas_sp.AAC.1
MGAVVRPPGGVVRRAPGAQTSLARHCAAPLAAGLAWLPRPAPECSRTTASPCSSSPTPPSARSPG